jgi:hypothetical protein
MQMNTHAGFCLLETIMALTAGTILTLLLLTLLHTQITQGNVINNNLTNARQALMLHKLLKNKIQPNYNNHCQAIGSNNIITGNDILNISCCKNNICSTSKIYLSQTKTLYQSTKNSIKEQIARNICEFHLRYGVIKNNEISYYSYNRITNWQNIAVIKATILICLQSQSFSTSIELAL